MTPVFALFLVIFLEGYAVLSTELLAIRLLLPFTGSGTDTVSILIAAILMPLAFGYFYGGRFRPNYPRGRTVRRRLLRNLVVAMLFLTPGLSYLILDGFFTGLMRGGLDNRLWLTAIYAAIFLVIPVYLLGQTVPLVSNYFRQRRLSAMAGRILFVSTLGSFMGAIFCTLVLMTFLGVHHSATITLSCLAIAIFILTPRPLSGATMIATILLLLMLLLNSETAMRTAGIVSNNRYNTVQIENQPETDTIVMKLNGTTASGVYVDSDAPRFSYVAFIEEHFIQPLREGVPRDILILGAGGMTMGLTDRHNRYVFVDIDGTLKELAETYLLQQKLTPNKRFEPMEARAFLKQSAARYDLIILDLYRDPTSAPEYLVTREFYRDIRDHLKPGGVVAANYIASPAFSDPFSIRLDNSFRAVFPNLNRQTVQNFNMFNRQNDWANIVYSAVRNDHAPTDLYTDDRNRAAFDKPARIIK